MEFLTYTKLQLEENVLVKIRNFTLDSALLLFRMFGDFTNSTPGECPLQEIYPSPLAPFPLPCPGEDDERIKWLKKKRGKLLIRFTQIVNVVGLFQKSGYNNCIVVNANVTIDAICRWVHTRDIIPIKLQFVVFHDHMHALSGLSIMSEIQTIFFK